MRSHEHGGGGAGARGGWRAGVWRAVGLSVGVHGLGLLVLLLRVRGELSGTEAGARAEAPLDGYGAPTFVDLAAADLVVPAPPVTSPPDTPPDLSAAREADVSRAAAAAVAPQAGTSGDDRAPAPDRGAGAGISRDDPAFRRDSSTLRERLTDGASIYQPSHQQTASRAASREAVRREANTGPGDSAATLRPRRAPPRASYGLLDPGDAGLGAPTQPGTAVALATPRAPLVPPVPATAERELAAAAVGPLDADRGPRSYDVEARGAVADDRQSRAASHETSPGVTDFTLAAASGHGLEGRGPGTLPGASPRSVTGDAAALPGVIGALPGPSREDRTRERQYARYHQEIKRRVGQALIWPKQLALRLEQGQTVVRFQVYGDGRVSGAPHVSKSSGFMEFDQAALDAVRRAVALPPPPELMPGAPSVVVLPVAFENPLIR